MALNVGDRLGPYEIVSALGADGMGEVYRARDTRLDRIVAVEDREHGRALSDKGSSVNSLSRHGLNAGYPRMRICIPRPRLVRKLQLQAQR